MIITINEFIENIFSDIIKELVNYGRWSLRHGYSKSNNIVKYQLYTGKHFYYMGVNGNIISVDDIDDFNYKGVVFFKE